MVVNLLEERKQLRSEKSSLQSQLDRLLGGELSD